MPPLGQLAASLAILLIAAGGAIWTAQGAIGPARPLPPAFAPPAGTLLVDGQRLPVFRWDGDGGVDRIGNAAARGDGDVGLQLYPGRSIAPGEEAAVLLDASLKTLWDLRTAPMDQALGEMLNRVLRDGRAGLATILQSEAFEEDYGPAFRDLAGDAIEAAWQAPETRLAARSAFGRYSEELLSESVPVVLPLLLDNAQQALRESFGANPARFLGQLIGGEIDRASLAVALERTLQEPVVAEHLDETLRMVVLAPETEALALAFGRALLRELAERQEALDLFERLLADRRFSPALLALKQGALDQARTLGELLLGLGVTEGVHPLAAVIIRSFLQLEGPHFVLVVPEVMAQRLVTGEPGERLTGERLHPLEPRP